MNELEGVGSPMDGVQMLSPIVEMLHMIRTTGSLSEAEGKEVDLVISRLRLIIYSRHRAASAEHQQWVRSVKDRVEAGVLGGQELDFELLRSIAAGA